MSDKIAVALVRIALDTPDTAKAQSPEQLAALYLAAAQAADRAGEACARVAVKLLKTSPGPADTPTRRIERFSEIVKALETKGVGSPRHDDALADHRRRMLGW
jgi:hypothetical protein